jgi:8-oxo-dGTP pyrophosphatase MutT (NUDIX family)
VTPPALAQGPFSLRAREGLFAAPFDLDTPLIHGDHELGGLEVTALLSAPLRRAAVLVPVVEHAHGPALLLTQRAGHLRQHAGQIAFPGGKIDDGDDGPFGAAVREAEEEIGIAATDVALLGYLAPYLSGTGYHITPVVAALRSAYSAVPNPAEVDDVFEVPLGFLMDPANHLRHEREWRGHMRRYYAISYGKRYIWGATAGIIRMLWQRLFI